LLSQNGIARGWAARGRAKRRLAAAHEDRSRTLSLRERVGVRGKLEDGRLFFVGLVTFHSFGAITLAECR